MAKSVAGKKAIFFVTSPRTPDKMLEEIPVLISSVGGQPWNPTTQIQFYKELVRQDFFFGTATGEMDFKARDRINRSPQALGFVDLKPTVALTPAGEELLESDHSQDIFLKQLLKFQLPSSLHPDKDGLFNVRPYLELMRLVRDAKGLNKVEIAIFVMQLTHHKKFDAIKEDLFKFRAALKSRGSNVSYKNFVNDTFLKVLSHQFADEIKANKISTRENTDKSLAVFLSTKRQNHRDYADAAIRYLRATGLFSYNPQRNRISVNEEKAPEVDYICANVPRDIYAYKDEKDYKTYLFSTRNLELLTDQREYLLSELKHYKPKNYAALELSSVAQLKDALRDLKEQRRIKVEKEATNSVQKNYKMYPEIAEIFDKITSKSLVDSPLFLEWNTWRALTMLNDGEINGNFRIDDEGLPLYSAPGNLPDIACDYADFSMVVEVTLSSGNKQYDMEGEPVARHLTNYAKEAGKDTYCLFIAPTISEATLAHYFVLNNKDVKFYGGKSKIIPLSLADFLQLIKNATEAARKPDAQNIKEFCVKCSALAQSAADEDIWMRGVQKIASTTFV